MELNNLQIRAMQEADLPAVWAIESSIYEFPWSERNFLDSFRAGYLLYCLERADELLGYVVMMPVVDEYHLLNISVRADLQGKGYGRFLLNWGLNQAREAGMQGMLLEVRPSNYVAKCLYEALGFVAIGVRKNYYPAAQGREDALVFLKRFDGDE